MQFFQVSVHFSPTPTFGNSGSLQVAVTCNQPISGSVVKDWLLTFPRIPSNKYAKTI